MRKKRLQNKVAESRLALPVVSVYTVMVCMACGLIANQLWLSFGTLVLSGFLMMELNNANALIRIYSRMVSCSYLLMSVMACFLLRNERVGFVQVCFAAFYVVLFRAYQDKRSVGSVFYASALLSIGSIWFAQLLYFVPVLWILLYTHILAGSWRTFLASVIGLLVPYWFMAGYYIYVNDFAALVEHFAALAVFQPLAIPRGWTLPEVFSVAFVVLAYVIGVVHFHRNSYMDKIRTRMLYEVFTIVGIAAIVFAALQPQHLQMLLGVLIVNTAPLLGHFIALTRTRLTNITFMLLLMAAVAITYYNVWNF